MSCEETLRRLDDYLDQTLPLDERRAVADHLRACAACRDEEAALRGLLARASGLPRDLAPSRDLWPAIDARLDDRSVLIGWFGGGGRALLAAAAGLLLVAAAVMVGYRVGRNGSVAPLPGEGAVVQASLDLGSVRGEYGRARTQLLAAVEARRGDVPPEALKVIEHNLDVIDGAVAEIEQALERHPNDDQLRGLLFASYRQGIDLLQRAVQLPDAV